jgi:hypothetical protein
MPEKSSAPVSAHEPTTTKPVGPKQPAGPAVIRRRVLAWAAVVLAVVLLFVAYLQVSRTYPENSDESNTLLMAWDLLHGHVLLHGWYMSDVSFYTTELPQYVLLERLFGLHTDTAHIGAAMTYTLVVLFAALLAAGRGTGRDAWPRMLLTTGIIFAPQLGVAVFILVLSVGHIGTSVPLMLIWLVLDRCKPRWPVPIVVGLLLTWVLVADPLVLLVGIIPLVAVCAVRVIGALAAARRAALDGRAAPGGRWLPAVWPARWYELALAVAAILAEGLASLINRLLGASGGFILHPVGYKLAPLHTWPKHAWVTGEGLLALFGAKPQGPAIELAFAVLHLAGVALVAWAMCRVARHFFSRPDLINQVLLVAMVVNVVAYVPSTLADATDLNAREFAVVLPFGAVLAGRTLAATLRTRSEAANEENNAYRWHKWLTPALLVAWAGYAASLGYAAAQPSAPAANSQLAEFLAAHHLTSGIGGYWESSVVTVGSDGAVTIRAVLPGTLQPDLWESKGSWYDPRTNRATFLVTDSASGFFNHWQPNSAALAALGAPAHTYHVGPYTVFVWNKNLLVQVSRG